MNHDIIAIGGSAGSHAVLLRLVEELPSELQASIFVVVHIPPSVQSRLPEMLSARGPLRATHPVHGERIVPGHIYVAPPDNHIVVRQGTIEVVRGPRENGNRPAVDTLFRTASNAYGPRVVGVVLSGYQDCGTAGMLSIKARGGIGVAQSPADSVAPDMPRSAIEHTSIDYVVTPEELGPLLARLVSTRAVAPPSEPNLECFEGRKRGEPAELVCPSCDGVLTEAEVRGFHLFRCHVGHTFSLSALARSQSEEVERALWAAVRALEESSALSHRLSGSSSTELRTRFSERQATQQRYAEAIKSILLGGGALSPIEPDGNVTINEAKEEFEPK